MRKVILSLAAAAATLAVAAPAWAQAWGNMTPARGYAAPGYGYANYNRSQVRALQVQDPELLSNFPVRLGGEIERRFISPGLDRDVVFFGEARGNFVAR